LLVEQVKLTNRKETVYNFEVQTNHSYFVGRLLGWVHNNNNCSLPSVRKISIDIEHIFSGHAKGGAWLAQGKKTDAIWPDNMKPKDIEKAVKTAYQGAKIVERRIEPNGTYTLKLIGEFDWYKVEMWLHLADNRIGSAYPLWK
jgi:nicotinate-nucleotide pyrophosphorylase